MSIVRTPPKHRRSPNGVPVGGGLRRRRRRRPETVWRYHVARWLLGEWAPCGVYRGASGQEVCNVASRRQLGQLAVSVQTEAPAARSVA